MIEVLLVLVAIGLSYVLNRLLIRFSERLNALHQNSETSQIRWASHSKPLVGGISFFVLFLFSMVLLLALPTAWVGGEIMSFALWPLLLVVTLGFFVGLADDAYTTKPFLKFIGQFGCGIILVATGNIIHLFDIWALDSLLTILWVVGIMNSINMLDNMDGITGTVSLGVLITSLTLMLSIGVTTGPFYWLTLSMIGTMVGYLLLNWHPSKLFMGDTGSQFLGALLAFVGIELFWNMPTASGGSSFFLQIFAPLMVFLMPIIDTTFVTVARLNRGQSPFVGGRDHTTHHLSYNGLSQKVIPIITLSVTLVSGMLIVLNNYFTTTWTTTSTLLFAGFVLAMFGGFFLMYRRGAILNRLKTLKAEREKLRVERLREAEQRKQLLPETLSAV